MLEASPGTTVNVFDPGHQPALAVDPGDTVVVASLDAAGYLEPMRSPGAGTAKMFPGDFRGLVAGMTLYLPVNVPGALLYLGDGHAAQGDGESCGTAIECPMTTRVTLALAAGRPLPAIHAQGPAGRITFGFSPDLNEAMGDALDAMVTWLAAIYGASRAEALALASVAADLRVTQVANGT